MRKGFVALATVLLVTSTGVKADSFVLGTSLELGNQGAYLGSEVGVQHLLQPFSLNTTVVISTINLALSGPIPVGGSTPPRSFLVQITNSIGSEATSANILGQASGTFPSGTTPEVVSVSLSATLGPGMYYLVLSSGTGAGSWTQSGSVVPSSVGSVGSPAAFASGSNANSALPLASQWTLFAEPSVRFSFQLAGTTSLPVSIDIKPDSDQNTVNLDASGVIPVAILSADDFDATNVDPESVSLAGASVKLIGKSGRYLCHPEDANGDHLMDLVCHINTAQFMIEEGSSVAVLEAKTFNGVSIRGQDTIRIVPDN